MADPKPVINVGKYLEAKGLEFSRVDNDGNYFINDNEGNEKKFRVHEFLKSKGVDTNKMDFSLNNADDPLDTSPVEIADRAALSLGNRAGSIDYLKQKFDAVKYNPEGELVVKKSGVWHRVDPESMGGNPWEMTRELVADLADAAPTIGVIGASIGAGIATGGSSLVAQVAAQGATGGAAEGIRTSLGRAVGTYKATAEEQIADIGLETLFNLGGAAIGAGVNASGKAGVRMLRKAGERLAKSGPDSQGLIANMLGPVTVGADNIHEMIADPKIVTQFLDDALTAGKSEAEAAQHLVQGQIDDLVSIANRAPKALSDKWESNARVLKEMASENFNAALPEIHKTMHSTLLSEGLIRVEDKVGRRVGNTLVRPAILTPEALMTSNLDDLSIRMFSFEELVKAQKKSGIPNKFANSREAYDMAAEMFTSMKNLEVKKLSGKPAVDQLMSFKQTMAAKTWELSNKANNANLGFAGKLFSTVDSVMDGQVDNIFAKNQMAEPWSKLNSEYNQTKSFLEPLMNARKKAIGSNDVAAFQPELNRILSAGSGNLANKNSLKTAVNLINRPEITQSFENIYKRNAAKAFVPKFGPYAKVAGSAAVGSVISGNPLMALGFAGSAVGTSPRLVGRMLSRSAQGGDMVEIGFKKLDFLKSLDVQKMQNLVNNPALLNSFLQTATEAAGTKQQVHQSLMSQAQQAAQPIAPPLEHKKNGR